MTAAIGYVVLPLDEDEPPRCSQCGADLSFEGAGVTIVEYHQGYFDRYDSEVQYAAFDQMTMECGKCGVALEEG
jgi:hypothetical protein